MLEPLSNVEPSHPKIDSFRTLRAVRDAYEVTGSARAVLWALAIHADGATGRNAYPCQDTIAAVSGCASVSTVKKHLKSLEAQGYIRRGDQSRAPKRPGRSVIVWDIGLDVLDCARRARMAVRDGRNASRASLMTPTTTNSQIPAFQTAADRPSEGPRNDDDLPREQPSELANPLPSPRQATDAALDATVVEKWMRYARNVMLNRADVLRSPDDLDVLLDCLGDGGRNITDPREWLTAQLTRRSHDQHESFLHSLWLSDVVEYDDSADAEQARGLLATCQYDDEVADMVILGLKDQGVRSPGLYLSRAADFGPAAVADVAERALTW